MGRLVSSASALAGAFAVALAIITASASVGSASTPPVDLNTCAGATKQVLAGTTVTLLGPTHVETNQGQMDKFLRTAATTLTVGGTALNASGGWSAPVAVAGTPNDYSTTWQQSIAAPAIGGPVAVRFDLSYQPDQSGLHDLTQTFTCALLTGQPVSARSGGTITTGDGTLSLAVPPAALTTDTTIVVQSSTTTPPASLGAPVTTVYDLGPTGTTFTSPVTVTVGYPATLPAGATPANLHVASYSNGTWRLLPTTVDTTTHTLTAHTTHFSLFTGTVTPGYDLVSGSLTDSAGVAVPAGIVAKAVNATGATVATDTTDAVNPGIYSLLVPDGGTYRFNIASTTGLYYVNTWLANAPQLFGATSYTITGPTTLPTTALASGVAFTGTVRDPANAGVANTTVTAISGTPSCCAPTAEATTDATGTYWLVVPSGYYRVRALPDVNATPPLARSFYNGTPTGTPLSGQALFVHLDGTVQQTTIDLNVQSGIRVRGTVHDSAAAPVANAAAQILISPPCCSSPGTAITDATGSFAIVVPAGTYTAQFWPLTQNGLASVFYNGQTTIDAANQFTPTGIDYSIGDTVLPAGIAVSGTVVDAAGIGIPNINVTANIAIGGNCCAGVVSTKTAANGTYTLYLAAGSYKLQAFANYGVDYPQQWFPNGTNQNAVPWQSITAPVTNENFTLPTGYPISGTVRDATTGASIPNVNMNASLAPQPGQCCQFVAGFRSVADGSFRIVVPAGTYILRANASSASHYMSIWYGDGNNPNNATQITVSAAAPSAGTGIAIALQQGYRVSGHVSKPDGTPASLIGVWATNPTSDGGCPGGCAQTNSNGDYDFVIAPGQWKIRFDPQQSNQQLGTTLLKAYWDGTATGTSSFASAGVINAVAGQTQTGVNATLGTGYVLSGTLRDASTLAPIVGANVQAQLPPPAGKNAFVTGFNTGTDGSFRLVVPAGSYVLWGNAPQGSLYVSAFYPGVPQNTQATQLSVDATTPSVANIDFRLAQGFVISGWLRDATTGAGIGGTGVNVQTPPPPGGCCPQGAGFSPTAADGSFRTVVPAGTYILRANAPQNTRYISTWYGGTTPDTATRVTVGSATPNAGVGIDFRMATGFAVSGVVYNAGTTTPAGGVGISANIVPSSNQTCCTWVGGTQSNPDGTFSFMVPSGTYVLNVGGGNSSYLFRWYVQGTSGTQDVMQATPVNATSDVTGLQLQATLGFRISGRVFQSDGVTGAPNVGIHADYVGGNDGCPGGCGATDGQGNFNFAIAPGSWILRIDPSRTNQQLGTALLRQYFNGMPTPTGATVITATAGGSYPTPINVTLTTGYRITGTVTVNGTPTAGVGVGLSYAPADPSQCCVGVDGMQSGPGGSFSFVVAPGTYVMNVGGGRSNYVWQWFNGATMQTRDVTLAQQITVVGGDVNVGNAPALLGYRVSGHVGTPTGGNAPNINVSFQDTVGQNGAGGQTDPSGNFDFAIPAGTFKLYFDPQWSNQTNGTAYAGIWYPNATSSDLAQTITASAGGQQAGLNATLRQGYRLTGTVVVNGTGTAGINVGVNTPATGPNTWPQGVTGTQSGPGGAFSIVVAPGSYVLNTGGGPSSYVFRWYDGSPNGTRDGRAATVVTVGNADYAAGNLPAMLGDRISGHITMPTPVRIDVNPQDATGACNNASGGGTDANGNFDFAIEPGSWKLLFNPSRSNQALGTLLVQTYLGGSTWSTAGTLTAVAGGTHPGLTATLTTGVAITGQVVSNTNVGIANAGVAANLTNPMFCGDWAANTGTDSSGAFTLVVPANASYRLFANGQEQGFINAWYGGSSFDTATPVAAGTTGVTIQLQPGLIITGQVTDAATQQPIANVQIGLTTSRDGCCWGGGAQTDASGTYRAIVAPGTYYVQFTPTNTATTAYVAQVYSGAGAFSLATPVGGVAGQVVSGINAQLATGNVITGTVSGAPAGSRVSVSANDGGPNATCCFPAVFTAQVDATGAYRLALPVGHGPVRIAFWPDRQTGYLSAYYNGTPNGTSDFFQASDVTAPASNVNVTLTAGLHMTGTVRGPGGAPIPGARVSAGKLYPNTTQCCADWTGAQTGPDGTYDMVVSPGTWRVRFAGPFGSTFIGTWYGPSDDFSTATSVAVSANVTGIDAQLATGVLINGRVLQPNGTPQGNVNVTAQITGPCCKWSPMDSNTDANGYFHIAVPANGSYIVQAGVNEQVVLLLWQWYSTTNPGTKDWSLATAIPVATTDVTISAMTLVQGAPIYGHVTVGGAPAALVNVNAQDAATGAWRGNGRTQSDGSYVLVVAAAGGSVKVEADYAGTPHWYGGIDFASATPVAPNQTGVDIAIP